MSTVSTINDRITTLAADVARVADLVATLKSKGAASQAELDAIDLGISTVQDSVKAIQPDPVA